MRKECRHLRGWSWAKSMTSFRAELSIQIRVRQDFSAAYGNWQVLAAKATRWPSPTLEIMTPYSLAHVIRVCKYLLQAIQCYRGDFSITYVLKYPDPDNCRVRLVVKSRYFVPVWLANTRSRTSVFHIPRGTSLQNRSPPRSALSEHKNVHLSNKTLQTR